VTNTNSDGDGSLRWAIQQANIYVGRDWITFNIPTGDDGYNSTLGVWFIDLTIVLPTLDDPLGVVIDGSSQPGTHAYLPGIIIRGTTSLPPGSDIFTIISTSNDNKIANLGIFNSQGDSILIESDQNNIESNQIFTSEMYGIRLIPGADHNWIHDNFICGQKLDSIYLDNAGTNTINNNIIGLQPDYIPTVPATSGNGLSLISSNLNSIDNNTISNNNGKGIYLSSSEDNIIENNTIGLSEDEQEQFGNKQYGILVENSKNNQIYNNWISANVMDGIRLTGNLSFGNKMEKNRIGMSLGGSAPNSHHGIGIYDNAHDNYVGRETDPSFGNTITFNGWSGVVVVNSPLGGNNYIGTNVILSNRFYGVHIRNSLANRIVSNTIVGNGSAGSYAGVRIENDSIFSDVSDRNLVKSNSITGNTGLGIQLVGDANAEILPPIFCTASCTQVTGVAACGGCVVQLFSDDDDEGMFLDGTIFTDSSGNFTWTGNLHGPNLTATVIDPAGNTSQFSIPVINACRYVYLPLITR
jgi:parallel beta-helix repeat protein